jgi:low molecular weight phosphotyrosine protein phosphatase
MSTQSGKKNSALFICLGNICRSPIAEAVFREVVKERKVEDQWIIDSAATGNWHLGGSPDDRAMRVLESNGINYSHVVRQIGDSDFEEFEWIFGMDEKNIADIKGVAPPGYKGKILLLGSFDPEGETIIRDPYFDGSNDIKGFVKCYEQCVRDCNAFLDHVMGGNS